MNVRKICLLLIVVAVPCIVGCNKNEKQETFNGFEKDDRVHLFAPGIVSTGMNERDACLSPDRETFYFTIQPQRGISVIVFSTLKNGKWLQPKVASFSGVYNDIEPVFHPDGKRLFFVSNRPNPEDSTRTDFDIWYVKKEKNGWSQPVNIGGPVNREGNEFYPSFTKNGDIYYCASYDDATGGEDLYMARASNEGYGSVENLGDSVNTKAAEYNAFVHPDGDYIVYTSHGWGEGEGGGDLFVAFKDEKGHWKRAINAGDIINSSSFEFCPSLSPDGTVLFFTSYRSREYLPHNGSFTYPDLQKIHNSPGSGRNGDIYYVSEDVIRNLNLKQR